jgi:phage portal protein BeeE
MGLLSRLRRPASAVDGLPFAENRLASPVPAQRFASVAYALPEFQLGKAVWPAYDARLAEDAYRKTALILRCLSLIAHAAGTAPLRVYDEANDDEEVADHPLRRLVRQPNPNQGEALFSRFVPASPGSAWSKRNATGSAT